MFDYAKFYREQIEWASRQLDWYNKDLVTINKLLKRSRREDRELVAYVCSKGPLTNLDWKIFVDKKYVGTETKRLLKMRQENYRWRNKYRDEITRYEKELAELKR